MPTSANSVSSSLMPPPQRRLLRPSTILPAALAFIVAYGVVGYLLLGYGVVDAVYMTVLALTTLGIPTERALTAATKLFTASLAVLGVTTFFLGLAMLATAVVEGRIRIGSWRRRMERTIAGLHDHFIVCAYGRVGRAVARELQSQGVPFVVIDVKADLEEQMQADGVPYIIGTPEAEAVLQQAGLARARGLVCAVDSDATNVYITLLARALNPKLFIVARAGEPESPERLRRAGADRVVSPYVMSGRHMSLLALRPEVVDYLDLVGRGQWKARLDELVVEEGSDMAGRSLREACGEARPLLLVRANEHPVPNPAPDEILQPGDVVVLFGEATAP
jgi:voltage-gated potassium channel